MATGFIGNQNSVRSYSEYFSGNDVTLAFLMGQAGYNMNGAVSLRVNIYGVAQPPSSFAVSGKTLTFFTAPPTGTSNIEVVHMVPYLNEMNPLQLFTFVDSMTSLNVVTLAGTSETFTRSNTSSLNATSAYIQSLDAVNFRGAIVASNYATFQAAVAAATTNANTLIVTSNVVMSATTTVPSTVPLVFTSNGRVTLQTGFNLWIQGPLEAPPTTRIFIGSGTANGFNAVPEAYTEWWGAARNGSTDDTLAFESAMVACANTTTIKLLSGSYIANVVNYSVSNSTIRLSGQGESSVIMLPNTNIFVASLIVVAGTNIIASFDHITFDQQQVIQLSNSDNQGIIFQAKGTTTNAAGLIVESCTFRNGCQSDISVASGDSVSNTTTFVQIRGNRFLGGSEGTTSTHDPRSINIMTPCDYIIEGNYFDLLRDRTAYGRAGIVCFDGWGVIANTAPDFTPKGVIVGNYLKRMGRSQTASTLGCIDAYNFGVDLLIDGNVILDCYGRGIQTKADARRVIISNNLVDGLANGIGGLLAVNSSPDYTAGGTILIEGNVLANNPYGDGLVITGAGVEEGTGVTFQSRASSVTVINNIIKNCVGNGIDESFHKDVMINNNVMANVAYGIVCQNVASFVTIRNNNISNTTAYGISVDSSSVDAVISITDNHIQDIPTINFRGISTSAGRSVLISGNHVQNVNGTGIHSTIIRNICTIEGNIVDKVLTHGIAVSEVGNLDVNHNTVSNTGNIGIFCQGGVYQSTGSVGVRGNRVSHAYDEGIRADNFQWILHEGNIVNNAGATGSVSTGIYSQQVGQAVSFIGNQVRNTGGVGISIGSANTGAKIIHQGNITNNTVTYGILNNSANVIVAIHGNQIANVSGTGRGIYIAANVAGQIVGNFVDAATVATPFFEVAEDGHSEGLNSWNATQGYGTAAPTIGIWKKNDIIWNTNAAASGNIGFVCTVAGSPGTWKNFGPIGA